MDASVAHDLVQKIIGADGDPDRQNALIEEVCRLRHTDEGTAAALQFRVRALAERGAPNIDYLELLGVEDRLGRL